MKRFVLFGLTLVLLTAACTAVSPQSEAVEDQEGVVTIFALEG